MVDDSKKTVTFMLPGPASGGPIGGYKVVFEYANRLNRAGFKVRILYPFTLNYKSKPLMYKIRILKTHVKYILKGCSCRKWFDLDDEVEERWVLTLNKRHVPDSDIFVATAVETAYYLKDYDLPLNHRLYLIQGYEIWGMSEDEVKASYGFGFNNIAVSGWLARLVRDSGNECIVLKNGFDFDYFRYTIELKDRFPHSICMMYHADPVKGCDDGFAVIRLLKERYPDLKVRMFGRDKRPSFLESWIEYSKMPDRDKHNEIYNSSAVYLAPSKSEGWGLTVGEAMICGAAVVCTDTQGFNEMIDSGKNGLMCPVADVDSMYNAVVKLFDDEELRFCIAQRALHDISGFSWDKSSDRFINLLKSL